MVTRLLTLALIILQMQLAANSPLRPKRSPRELQSHQPVLFSTHPVIQQSFYTRNRGNIHLLAPIPLTQLYLHQNLHLIPANSNLLHGSVQHFKENVKIPQTLSQNTANYTHPTLLPLLIPIHNILSTSNRLIPLHDLSVIPLQRNKIEKAQYRAAEKNEEDNEEPSNQFRNFYGGYGNGLFFGGHGSGHGYYAYGK